MRHGRVYHASRRPEEGCGDKFRHPRYGRLGSSPAWPLSAITSRLPEPGDITPRIMDDWGQQSCRVWLAKAPVVQDTNIVTGPVFCVSCETRPTASLPFPPPGSLHPVVDLLDVSHQ